MIQSEKKKLIKNSQNSSTFQRGSLRRQGDKETGRQRKSKRERERAREKRENKPITEIGYITTGFIKIFKIMREYSEKFIQTKQTG